MRALIGLTVVSVMLGCVPRTTGSTTASEPPTVTAASLVGKVYKRDVISEGLFGQPAGKSEHTLEFLAGSKVRDNGSTFFGNPPEVLPYLVKGSTLIIVRNSVRLDYRIASDLKSISRESMVFQLVEPKQDASVTAELIDSEKVAAIKIFDRVKAPLKEENPICFYSEVTIRAVTMGFNPSHWSAVVEESETELSPAEINDMIKLFNRLQVAALTSDGLEYISEAKIKQHVCGFNPASWTATYVKTK